MDDFKRGMKLIRDKERINAENLLKNLLLMKPSRDKMINLLKWRGRKVFDVEIFDDENLNRYLMMDPLNFVLELPNGNYEGLNLNKLKIQKRIDDLKTHFDIDHYDTLYACKEYKIHDYQKGSKNVITSEEFMKVGIYAFPILVPDWIL